MNQEFQKYLENFTLVQLYQICRHFKIPKRGIKNIVIKKLVNANIFTEDNEKILLTKEKVIDMINNNKNKKHFVICHGPGSCACAHIDYIDDINEDYKICLTHLKDIHVETRCVICKDLCSQTVYPNVFYE